MATLLYESKLNAALEEIIRESESYILIMCPYLKLHDRLKDCKTNEENPGSIINSVLEFADGENINPHT